MIVLSEASERLTPSSSARDIVSSTEAAKLAGWSVYYIEQDFFKAGNAEAALWHIPKQTKEVVGFWIGFIPSLDRYRQIYEAALSRGIRLVNSPLEHQIAQEFDHAYPRLQGLTPESLLVDKIEACAGAADHFGFPVFVKGAIQSQKAKGWKACVAEDLGQLEALTKQLLGLEARTRGRVVVRKLVRLRHHRTSPEGFPLGREYRAFVCQNQVVAMGYYWEGEDDLKVLSDRESEQVRRLALEAARKLNVPFVAVDIGQLESLEWVVIETGDGQFSGLSQVPRLQLWHQLRGAFGK